MTIAAFGRSLLNQPPQAMCQLLVQVQHDLAGLAAQHPSLA